jgi:hypothetical protein
LDFINCVTVNIGFPVSLLYANFDSFVYTPSSDTEGPYSSFICIFWGTNILIYKVAAVIFQMAD